MEFLDLPEGRLECAWYGPRANAGPTLVFLHEGLGSVSAWRDFPQRVADECGLRAFAYSRRGYGRSERRAAPWPLTYMHEEAAVLPSVLAAAGTAEAVLVGHSDGASIALLHAATGDPRVRALVLEAPHVFVEDLSVQSIAAAANAFVTGELRERLRRHHADNVDDAFWGWNRAWLDPGFRSWNIEAALPNIHAPMLLVQGEDDPYGTVQQLDAIARQSGGTVETIILSECGHAPHRDQAEATVRTIHRFVRRCGW